MQLRSGHFRNVEHVRCSIHILVCDINRIHCSDTVLSHTTIQYPIIPVSHPVGGIAQW